MVLGFFEGVAVLMIEQLWRRKQSLLLRMDGLAFPSCVENLSTR